VATVQGYVYEYTPGHPSDPLLGAPSGHSPLAGASVSAGGKSTSTGQDGGFVLSAVPVTATEATISMSGYDPLTRALTLSAGQTQTLGARGHAGLVMQRTDAGNLSVTSTPSGAQVSLNGAATGRTTPTEFNDIPPGTYTVRLLREGYTASSRSVSLSSAGASVSVTLTPLSDSPSGDLSGAGEAESFEMQEPTTWTYGSLAPASAAERQALLAIDGEVTPQAVSSAGVRVYEDLIAVLCEGYNEEVIPLSCLSSVPMLQATYRGSSGVPISGTIDVYYTGYDPNYANQPERFNAFASYEAIYLYDNLFLALDEAVALLFLTENSDEWVYYQFCSTSAAVSGNFFSVVPVELRDVIVMDPDFGPVYADLLAGAIAAVGLHEVGHVNLGHCLQKARLAGFSQPVADIVNRTALNWPFEFQADIFSAHALYGFDEPVPMAGGLVFCIVLGMGEIGDYTPFIFRTHPPAPFRAFIYWTVAEGENLTGYLQPLLPNLKQFAWLPYGSVAKSFRDVETPLLQPVLGISKTPSTAPELLERTPKVPAWFFEAAGGK